MRSGLGGSGSQPRTESWAELGDVMRELVDCLGCLLIVFSVVFVRLVSRGFFSGRFAARSSLVVGEVR